jgi:hypothetical protein
MRNLALAALLAGTAALGGCTTVTPVALVPGQVCGTYGLMDRNNDGTVTAAEWNGYRTGAYGGWDLNRDGRVSQSEFQSCYAAGGFLPATQYNAGYWNYYWSTFDTNRDGFLSSDEYWSSQGVDQRRPQQQWRRRHQRMDVVGLVRPA